MADQNPELQVKLAELDHELEVRLHAQRAPAVAQFPLPALEKQY